MIKLYTMDASEIDLDDAILYDKLSQKRIEKLERIKNKQAKRLSAAAEILLNEALSEWGIKKPVKWSADEKGKPYLVLRPDIHFNLTHSGKYAACVISDAPCGIDIQYMRDVNIDIAERFFSHEEKEYVQKSKNPQEAFYEIWVRKESFVKAVGVGITISLKSFCVLDDAVEYENEKYLLEMREFEDKEYKLCTCKKLCGD